MVLTSGKFRIPLLYEDDSLLVVVKPYNLLVQGDQSQAISLYDILKEYRKNSFLGIVQRLDKVVYGIMVLAKNSKTAAKLSNLIKTRNIKKTYHAIVEGQMLKSATLEHYILKSHKKAIVFSQPKEDAKKAILSYSLLESFGSKSLIEIQLKTGRYNQIRAQLAYIKRPIVQDYKYQKLPQSMTAIALIAKKLSFIHPFTGENFNFDIPYPANWKNFIK